VIFLTCRTFLPASLKVHKRSCTADKPMIRQERDASYVAKAEAKVNYPKFNKKDKKTAPPVAADSRQGDEGSSGDGGGGGVQLPQIRRLSRTMPKVYPPESDEPSIDLLVDILHNNAVFDAAENRRELELIITRFIAEKTAPGGGGGS
jgi:hypothetical protein